MREFHYIIVVRAALSDGSELIQPFSRTKVKEAQKQFDEWERMRIVGESINGSQIAEVNQLQGIVDPTDWVWLRSHKITVDFSKDVEQLLNEI